MADTPTQSPEGLAVETPAPPPVPTPLQTFTAGLVPQFVEAGQARERGLLEATGRRRDELASLQDMTATQDVERRAARAGVESAAAKKAALPPPDISARPFLAPGPDASVLSQLQAALTGITQMVMGAGGLRGNGHAIAAVAALKGGMEGWAAGDHERAETALKGWHANAEKLQQDYLNRLAGYRELLTDQRRSVTERLAEIGIRANIDRDEDTARAAREGNLGQLLSLWSSREDAAQRFGLQFADLQQRITAHNDNIAELRRAHDMMDARTREIARQREEDRLALVGAVRDNRTMSGTWIDASKPGVARADGLTFGEFKESGGREKFKQVQPQQLQAAQLIVSQGLPAIDQMKKLAPEILAKYGGQNLAVALENAAKGKLSDPALRQFEQAATTVATEYSRATGGSAALRKFVLDLIRETEVPNTWDRLDTANRLLENTRTVMWNYVRELKGRKPYQYPSFERTLDIIKSDTGQKGTIKLKPYEPLPAGVEVDF